jgi:hypothetical protein
LSRAVALVLVLVLGGCASPRANGAAPRAIFAVDEAAKTFTLTIETPGRSALRIAGDALGTPIPEAQRRELLSYFDAHIARLEGVATTEKDVKWMRLFREVYGVAERAPR